jgi:hypothetical protein
MPVSERGLELKRIVEELNAKYGLNVQFDPEKPKYLTPEMVWTGHQLVAFDGSLPRRKVYEALKQAGGGPISVSELAKLMGKEAGGIASCLRSMEKKGLVKRGPDKRWEINTEYVYWEEL